MKQTWKDCSPSSRRAGLTLIEVVAGVAILGVILVAIVTARSRHVRQLAKVTRVHAAVDRTDRLVGQWWMGTAGVPVEQSGLMPDDATLRWRTRLVPNETLGAIEARVVRVEVFDARTPAAQQSEAEPLVALDMVLPVPKRLEPDEPSDIRAAVDTEGRR